MSRILSSSRESVIRTMTSTEISYAKRTEKKEIEAIMDDVRENDQCLFFVGVTIILWQKVRRSLRVSAKQ